MRALLVIIAVIVFAGCAPVAKLRVQRIKCEVPFGFRLVSATGSVTNISKEPIYDAVAVVEFKDDHSTVLDKRTRHISPLRPGQTSKFEVVTTQSPDFSTCDVGFQDGAGRVIPHVEGWFGPGMNPL